MAAWRSEKKRQRRDDVMPLVSELGEFLGQQGLEYYFGGSLRREEPTVGDLDALVVTPTGRLDADLIFEGVELPSGVEWGRSGRQIAQGSFTLPNGDEFHVDFWACKPAELGAMLVFITGPKELNVAQRAAAKAKGLSLSQVGLLDVATKAQLDDGTERGIYSILGIPWMEPTERSVFAAKRVVSEQRTFRVSSSDGKREYEITVHGGHVECTCPGFTYRSNCKHADKVREEL